jgi:hypothetical protein
VKVLGSWWDLGVYRLLPLSVGYHDSDSAANMFHGSNSRCSLWEIKKCNSSDKFYQNSIGIVGLISRHVGWTALVAPPQLLSLRYPGLLLSMVMLEMIGCDERKMQET